MVNDFGHGSDTARTRLGHGSIVLINDFNSQQRKKEDGEKRWEAVDLVPGFSRRRREKEEEGKMRIGMGVKVKEGVGCLGSGEWAEGRGGGGGGGGGFVAWGTSCDGVRLV